jgi:hypothetical protein
MRAAFPKTNFGKRLSSLQKSSDSVRRWVNAFQNFGISALIDERQSADAPVSYDCRLNVGLKIICYLNYFLIC